MDDQDVAPWTTGEKVAAGLGLLIVAAFGIICIDILTGGRLVGRLAVAVDLEEGATVDTLT